MNVMKKAFSLIEISLAIVIISIILSVVLFSKTLINAARVNKVYEEYGYFNTTINIFISSYGCMPGDCTSEQISDLAFYSSDLFGSSGICVTNPDSTITPKYSVLGTWAIESETKRSCMMAELSTIGDISINKSLLTTTSSLANSIPGINVPYAKFSKQAIWDYRLLYYISPGYPYLTWPFYLIYNDLLISGKTSAFVLHSASDTGGISNISGYEGITGYPLSANLAYKIDLKFDDGLPYT